MSRLRAALALAAFGALALGCAASHGNSALCTCDSAQLYDDATKSCVASADFVPPADGTCTDDGTPVCGCDDQGYTSECAAYAVGVEVQYAGTCHASSFGSGGGFGW